MDSGQGQGREGDNTPAAGVPGKQSGQESTTTGSNVGPGTPSSPPRRRRRWGLWIGGAIAAALLFLTLGTVLLVVLLGPGGPDGGGGSARAPVTFQEEYVSGEGREKVAVLTVEGTIGSEGATGALATPAATPETLKNGLRQAAEDEDVRAVVLEVNSPGGGVTASARMRDEILDFKETSRKPVVVSMGDMAASGGYYISAPADSIVANPSTLTGSLGVIISLLNYEEAQEKLGLREEVVKSGELKDIGSPANELTPEERGIFQELVDEDYDEFVRVIVEGRGLPEDRVRELADGRIYSGRQAEDLGLVDELGDLESATGIAEEIAGVDEATVVRYTQEPGLAELLQARLAPQKPEALEVLEEAGLSPSPELQYLYRP